MPEEEEESKCEADIGNLEDKAWLKKTVAMLTPSFDTFISDKPNPLLHSHNCQSQSLSLEKFLKKV